MKLYGRLLSILARSPFKERVNPMDKVITKWTVLPNDIDVFGHMNNGRYAMVMDLARVDFIARIGILGKIFKNRWIVPVGNTQIDFKRALKPFAKYEIHTQLVYWDDTWFYFKQDFVPEAHPDKIAATGYVKAVFKDKSGIVSTQQVIDEVSAIQEETAPPERPSLSGVLARKFDLRIDEDAETNLGRVAAEISQNIQQAPDAKAQPSVAKTWGATHDREPIAIVGIGCRFPGGVSKPEELWDVLLEGRDCVIDIPSTRWDPKKFYDPGAQVPGKAYVHKAGILTQDINDFDPAFFGIAPREAEILDPMQRLLLEVSWEAFEDAGISPKSLSGSDTSVFVGGFVVDSMIHQYSPLNRNLLGPQSATASSLTLLANRLSYFYDFRGASVSLDTACSSSLVAVHQACQSIWNGDSKAALVGGVNMLLAPETQISMCKGKFLSPNGRCNTFGAGADGYVRGEGAALVVLKPLSEAIADGNQIYSVIRGAAVNQDGRTNGITVPNGESQMAAMRSALAMANIRAEQISYMEAHGTGTPVGDPIEANALGTVLGKNRNLNEACPIGSLKTNVGHMEACAGIGGLIKSALVLKHRKLVPHLHLTEVNPNIDLDALKLRVPLATEALPQTGSLYAGVNSFGYGGTNAHVILESPPQQRQQFKDILDTTRPISLLLSGASEKSLQLQAAALTEQFKTLGHDTESITTLMTALATQKAHLPYRAWVNVQNAENAQNLLKKLADGEHDVAIEKGHQESSKVMFVYTGMGPQWWAMGRELYASEPVYRNALDECDKVFKAIAGWSILKELLADEADSKITQTQIAQPANLAVQVGLTRLFASWGIEADAVMGHSIGEVGSAWASGSLSLQQAFLVAFHRSRLQATTAGKGGMLAVGLSADEANQWLADNNVNVEREKVSIAAINSPSAVTLAGEMDALSGIAEQLEIAAIFNKFLKVEVPYHSPVMNEIEYELKRELSDLSRELNEIHEHIKGRGNRKPLYSTVTTELMESPHDGEYWWRNVRESVFFAPTCAQALKDGFNTFVEIGPHPVLASSIREVAKSLNKTISLNPSLIRNEAEQESVWKTVSKLYCAGVDLDWSRYFGRCSHVDLPLYAWDKSRYKYEGDRTRQYRLPSNEGHPLVARTTASPTPAWHVELNAFALPYVQDHQVGGSILFPGAGYVELGLALAKKHLPATDISGITLEGIEFLSPAVVMDDENVGLVVTSDEQDKCFQVRYKRGESEPVLSAQGRFFSGNKAESSGQHTFKQLLEVFGRTDSQDTGAIDKETLYESLGKKGLVYGPAFQAVKSIQVRPNEVLAKIELPEHLTDEGYLLHPVILDAALHSLIAGAEAKEQDFNVIPMGMERLQWLGDAETSLAGKTLCAHGRIVELNNKVLTGDIDIYDEQGELLVRLEGLICRVMQALKKSDLELTNQWAYQRDWFALPELDGRPSQEPSHADLEELATACFVIHEQLDDTQISVSQGLPSEKPSDSFKALPQAWTNDKLAEAIDAMVAQGRSASIIDLRLLSAEDELLIDRETHQAASILETVQALLKKEISRYTLATPKIQKVIESDQPQLHAALTEGMMRTVMTECPNLKITLLDVDDTDMADDLVALRRVWEQIEGYQDEQELAYRSGQFYALRLDKYECKAPQRDTKVLPAKEVEAYALSQQEKGKIESLVYVEADKPKPEASEVLVKMAYSSLHFKDLMKVLGLLSDDALKNTAHEHVIGMEGTAIVEAVGDKVSDLKAGDRVYVWGEVMNSHICIPRYSAVKVPDALEMADATNLVTYLTVYHSFVEMARIRAGETVLVHSATGGVGLAALNLAKHLGVKVIATAGTEHKREYLRSLGIEHVADSRSLSFVDQVKAWTNGTGVDVVLNFTPGEIMHKSIDCLAPSGRFIELGKQSFEGKDRINLKPFTENLSYFAVDLDRLTKQNPMYIGKLVGQVMTLLIAQKIPPLPCEYYTAVKISEAFRVMSRGEYTGKLGIKHDASELDVIAKLDQQRFSKDASYIITGGLGGFGLQVAKWMSLQGAGHLVLLSRSGPKSDEAQTAIKEMYANGTTVTALACDVSDHDVLAETLKLALEDMPSLKGVMHAAMVLDDKMVADIDQASLQKVVNAKALSAWNLHKLTRDEDLDFMVFFSSISSLVGNAGQANYVAANNFLDQLAQYRVDRGFAATSVNWGVFLETGVVARNDQLAKHLSQIGITPFTSQQALTALGIVLDQNQAQIGIMDVDWARFDSMLVDNAGKSRFKTLASQAQDAEGDSGEMKLLEETFADRNSEERAEFVRIALAESVAAVMRLNAKDLKPSKSLRDLGLDSLMAVEIDVEFSSRTGLDIPSTDIASGPTLEELEQRLLKRLEKALPVNDKALAADKEPLPVNELNEEARDKPSAVLGDTQVAEEGSLLNKVKPPLETKPENHEVI